MCPTHIPTNLNVYTRVRTHTTHTHKHADAHTDTLSGQGLFQNEVTVLAVL